LMVRVVSIFGWKWIILQVSEKTLLRVETRHLLDANTTAGQRVAICQS